MLRAGVRGTAGLTAQAAAPVSLHARQMSFAAILQPKMSNNVFVLGRRSERRPLKVAGERFMSTGVKKEFKKVMSCNRGEISIRFARAATELGMKTVAVYSKEDRHSLHRYKADQAFLVGKDKSPVGAYLDYMDIISVAKQNKVDAIHPGYGLLSENAAFAKACKDAGIEFIGPTHEVLGLFGDKTSARNLAVKCGVPVIPGTDGPCTSLEQARECIEGASGIGYPVMCKAGDAVVRSAEELEEHYNSASREALTAFGDGTMFIERLVERPRHVEVQVIGDGNGGAVHLFERDCSVQYRHQKIVEIAPATSIPQVPTLHAPSAVLRCQCLRSTKVVQI